MRTYPEYLAMVEGALQQLLRSLGEIPQTLLEAMEYSLMAGGKRLRPVMLLAACEMGGGDADAALPFACALEMIHTYSLIHDDLPAMDNDDYRRGRLTNHKVYGDGTAMPDLRGAKAAEAIARRSGVTGMIAGQVMDTTQEGTEPTADKVGYIHAHKTADLLTAPMEAGLLLAGAPAELLEAGCRYGYHIGVAFQIVDDLLDVVGDAALLGKKTGMDAALGKLTWVAVRGVDGAREDAAMHTSRAVAALEGFGEKAVFFKDLAQSTLQRVK